MINAMEKLKKTEQGKGNWEGKGFPPFKWGDLTEMLSGQKYEGG